MKNNNKSTAGKTARISVILISAAMFFTTSCATVFTSSKQSIYFETTPPGAKIQINGID